MEAMNDPNCRQIPAAKDSSPPLKAKSEILFNVMGRFLQLRGFTNERHELTPWGRALAQALSSPDKLEDSVYLAIEMLRLGLLDDQKFLSGSTKMAAGEEYVLSLVCAQTRLTM